MAAPGRRPRRTGGSPRPRSADRWAGGRSPRHFQCLQEAQRRVVIRLPSRSTCSPLRSRAWAAHRCSLLIKVYDTHRLRPRLRPVPCAVALGTRLSTRLVGASWGAGFRARGRPTCCVFDPPPPSRHQCPPTTRGRIRCGATCMSGGAGERRLKFRATRPLRLLRPVVALHRSTNCSRPTGLAVRREVPVREQAAESSTGAPHPVPATSL